MSTLYTLNSFGKMDSQLGKCLYLTGLWESLCCIFLIHYRCGRKQLPVGRVMPGTVVLGAVRRQPTQTSEQANKQPSSIVLLQSLPPASWPRFIQLWTCEPRQFTEEFIGFAVLEVSPWPLRQRAWQQAVRCEVGAAAKAYILRHSQPQGREGYWEWHEPFGTSKSAPSGSPPLISHTS